MALGGTLLKSNSSLIRALEFLISLFVLGTFSYYIGVIHRNSLYVPIWIRAVEGIVGAAVIYTFLAVILTFFLGGVMFFAFLGILLDLLFCGAFIAVAVLARDGAGSCSGRVSTPLGDGMASGRAIGGSYLHRICKLEKAIFAVAIANAILFLISAVLQYLLGRYHQRQKRYGPSPSNDYTSGEGKTPFWKRKRAGKRDADTAELGTVGTAPVVVEKHHHHNNDHDNDHNNTNNHIRPSNDTALTGSTMANHDAGYGIGHRKHAEPTVPVIYDPSPGAPVHRPGYPHIEPEGGHTHTHMPAATGAHDGYGAGEYGNAPHSHTNY